MSDVNPYPAPQDDHAVSTVAVTSQFKLHRVFSRLVLLGLAAPLIALAIVFWILLPGGVAGIAYRPSDYSQVVQLHPDEWKSRTVSISGYLDRLCANSQAPCDRWVLLDTPRAGAVDDRQALALLAVQVLPQHESGLYTFLRHLIPGMNKPFPMGLRIADAVTVTGSLGSARPSNGVPIFVPNSR